MAILPRYLATTPPPRESGLARATDIGALTRTGDIEVWRGVSRIGGAIRGAGELGFDAYQRRRSLDDIIEEGIATQRAQESFNQAEDAAELIDVTADMPDPNDPDYMKTLTSFSTTKRDRLFADAVKDIEKDAKKLSEGFSTPANKARFENWYNKNYTRFADRVRHMYDAKLDAYQQAALDKLVEDAAKNGNTKIANFYIDVMDKLELLTPQQATARKEQVIEIDEQEEILLAINYAGATLLEDDIKAASERIESSEVFSTEAEKAQYRNQLKSVLNNARALAKEQAKAMASEANKQLTDLMGSKQLTITEIQARREILDDTDYESWTKIALSPLDKKGNPVEAGQLYGDALDIWRGAITKVNFDKKLRNSLARDDGINENEFKSLMQTAEQTLKSSQAEALNRADTEAGRLIVDYREEDAFAQYISDVMKGLEPDVAKLFERDANERRKFQFWFLSQYNKEMRDWITDHPDKAGKDFYQYSEQLKHQYWNADIEDIKTKKMEREKVITGGEEKPKTMIMVSPEGKRYSVPVGKKQLFIDNGYTEE